MKALFVPLTEAQMAELQGLAADGALQGAGSQGGRSDGTCRVVQWPPPPTRSTLDHRILIYEAMNSALRAAQHLRLLPGYELNQQDHILALQTDQEIIESALRSHWDVDFSTL